MRRLRISDNKDTYLHQPRGPGTTFYARVTVPRTLVKVIGSTHLRCSLRTTSKAEANLRKHAEVGRLKQALADMQASKAAGAGTPGLTFADAKALRDHLEAVRVEDDERAEELEGIAADHAETLEQLYGTAHAKRWFRTATTNAETLSELMDRWLSGKDVRESTKLGHRKALKEVLAFAKNEHAYPSDIDAALALRFIDNDLTTRGLAANTISDRLVSLGGFWDWMATRNVLPRDRNPWKGHHVSRKQHQGTRPPKRKGGFTDDELVRLLVGDDRVKSWPTYAYLPDLIVLGMFTGARLESLAAMTRARVEQLGDGYVVRIENDKNDSGVRPVGITHPAPVGVVKRRLKATTQDMLFTELRQGGADDKWSASATKAFVRYRRAVLVPDGTDFHSFRRRVMSVMEQAGLLQGEISRFVGHLVGTIAADTYAGPRAATWALEVSRKVRYAPEVEAAALAAARCD